MKEAVKEEGIRYARGRNNECDTQKQQNVTLPLAIMDCSTAKNDADTGCGCVQHGNIPGFLKCSSTNHKDNNVLWAITTSGSTSSTLNKWIAGLFESHLQQLFQNLTQLGLVLCVHVLDTLEASLRVI